MILRFFTFLSIKLWIGIAATLFDSMSAFLISFTVPIATGPTTAGDIGLDGVDEGSVLKGDGVLTGLTDRDLDGDLTMGQAVQLPP